MDNAPSSPTPAQWPPSQPAQLPDKYSSEAPRELTKAERIPPIEEAMQEAIVFLLWREKKKIHPKSIELPHLNRILGKFPKEIGAKFVTAVTAPEPLKEIPVIRNNMSSEAIDAVALRMLELLDQRAASMRTAD